ADLVRTDTFSPLFLPAAGPNGHLPAFPTRRSSDLTPAADSAAAAAAARPQIQVLAEVDTVILREVFTYAGGSRDPFVSLLGTTRSEEHTSELQSRENLVCRLLLEKKKGRTA